MANKIIKSYSANIELTITLASLITSTVGSGRQCTIETNATSGITSGWLTGKFTLGTSPTGNRAVYVHRIDVDNNVSPHRSDGAGASDANLKIVNATLVKAVSTGPSPSTGEELYLNEYIKDLAPSYGFAVSHDTGGTALNSTGSNHYLRFTPDVLEVQ